MPTAVLTLPAAPEQARTARLVAGAAARRAGVDPDSLDDVRLAVAEAVARAVLRSMADAPGIQPDESSSWVSVAMTDDGQRFEIAVADRAEAGAAHPGAEADVDEELALSVMQSLAAESRIDPNPDGGRTIVLAWPVADA